MDHSQVEHSAKQFGVKLKKVVNDKTDSTEKMNLVARKSNSSVLLSHTPGVPSNCETRAHQRRSLPVPNNQVALRQEMAEKAAIDRQQKKLASRSWDKRSKPPLQPKPILKSSSMGNIHKSANLGSKKCVVQRKSPLVVSATTSQSQTSEKSVDVANNNTNCTDTWLSSLYGWYGEYKPMLDVLYVRISDAASRQVVIAHKIYSDYQKVFNKEARRWRNVRLRRRAMHGHRFLAVGIPDPSWCDLCAGVVWGRSTVCLQCVTSSSSASSKRSSESATSTSN